MRRLRMAAVALAIVGVSSIAWAQDFADNFDSYTAGTVLHGIGGWKGWGNVATAGAPVSNKYAFSGKNSVADGAGSDLVHEFTCNGGRWVISAMQYIPSGSTGAVFFILMSQYADSGSGNEWAVQMRFTMDTGAISPMNGAGTSMGEGQIIYDQWVEVKCIIDLDKNTVDQCYNGQVIGSHTWSAGSFKTFRAIDLYSEATNDSFAYYDDVKLQRYYIYKAQNPEPASGTIGEFPPILKWVKGDNAKTHEMYFGTTPELTAADFKPPRLAYEFFIVPVQGVPGTTYYWRVDEVMADGTKTPGDVWSFTVAPNTAYAPVPRNGDKWIDPNTLLSWKPGLGAFSHELYFGTDRAAVAARDAGVFKGVLNDVSFAPGTLAKDTTYYWAVDEADGAKYPGDVWSFTVGGPSGGVKAEYFRGTAVSGAPFVIQIEPAIDHAWGEGVVAGGVSDQVSARWTADLEIVVADTYTFITTSDDGVRLWLDDKRIVNNWTDHGTTDNPSKPIQLNPGFYSLRMEWYEQGGGAVAQLSWQTPTLERQIIPGGALQPPVHARAFYPANGDVNVPQNAALIWTAGDDAVTHDVYLGQDQAAVAAATPADAAYQGSQALGAVNFTPGALEAGKTYYWRVDEVNNAAPGSPWKGMVWSFTTATILIVDNFEGYTNYSPNRLFQTWIDGVGFSEDEYFPTGDPGNNSTSAVGHDIWAPSTTYNTIAETAVVHGGRQSMPVDFNNLNSPNYAEAVRTWKTAQNWTAGGADTLVLYVQGKTTNRADRLFVALEDSSGKIAVVAYTDDTAVTSPKWVEWKIPLSSFTGVKTNAVKKMYLGVGNRDKPVKGGAGTVFFDDIQVLKAQ